MAPLLADLVARGFGTAGPVFGQVSARFVAGVHFGVFLARDLAFGGTGEFGEGGDEHHGACTERRARKLYG